jgi:RNA polymerase sporulation-specific sigma factor
VKSFPKPLSAKEETDILNQCKQGSKEARDTLIERNLRLVAHIVKKYNMADKEIDDLISIGTIGLIKAIDTFDADKGIRLATYASRCIDNAILFFMTPIILLVLLEKNHWYQSLLRRYEHHRPLQ